LLYIVVLVLDNFSLFLDINSFFTILDNRLRFFNNNIRIIIFVKSVETFALDIVVDFLKYFMIKKIDILYFVL